MNKHGNELTILSIDADRLEAVTGDVDGTASTVSHRRTRALELRVSTTAR
jgi:hypothetical protein